jgi:hypothetical protein
MWEQIEKGCVRVTAEEGRQAVKDSEHGTSKDGKKNAQSHFATPIPSFMHLAAMVIMYLNLSCPANFARL